MLTQRLAQSYPFGWEPDADGFRGHIFATPDNSSPPSDSSVAALNGSIVALDKPVSTPSEPAPMLDEQTTHATKRAALLLDDSDWPAWVREAFDYMEAKGYSGDFTQAIEYWTVIERLYGWKTSVR